MKKFLLLIAFVTNSIYAEGFLAGTLVKTRTGYIPIERLEKDDLVLCHDGKGNYVEKPVTAVMKKEVSYFLRLTINGEIINVSPEQKFYRPTKQRWTKAQHLTQKHLLLQHRAHLIRVDKIVEIEQKATVFAITVADHHNFLVSRQNIVVHNIFPLIAIALAWGASAGGATVTVGILGATITTSVTTVAGALGVFGAAVAVGISRMGRRQGSNNPTPGNGNRGTSNNPSTQADDTGPNPDATTPASDSNKSTSTTSKENQGGGAPQKDPKDDKKPANEKPALNLDTQLKDPDTILKSSEFRRTNVTKKQARVYEKDGKYYHRDTFHKGEGSHLEVYDKRGNHIGKADPFTGEIKPGTAEPTYKLDWLLPRIKNKDTLGTCLNTVKYQNIK